MTWIYFIAFEIARNYFLIETLNMRPHYGWSKILRFFSGVGFLFAYYPDPLTMGFDPWNYALFQIMSLYLCFDAGLNVLRGKPLFYQGKNSGKLDSLSKKEYYALKVGALVVLILSLI